MPDIFTNSLCTLTFCPLQKKIFSWLNNQFMVRNQLISMSSNAKNKLQMCSVIQHHSWSRQMWGQFTQYTHSFSVTKNDLSWLNNLVMVRTQLISMSSYAKNKLQMCSVNQHQFRRRQMCRKFSKFTQYTHFWSYKNDFAEQSIHGKEHRHCLSLK